MSRKPELQLVITLSHGLVVPLLVSAGTEGPTHNLSPLSEKLLGHRSLATWPGRCVAPTRCRVLRWYSEASPNPKENIRMGPSSTIEEQRRLNVEFR